MTQPQPISYRGFKVSGVDFRIPESGYVFDTSGFWAKRNENTARVGLADWIRLDPRQLLVLRPPDLGDEVHIFEKLCSFETDQISLDVNSPVTGIVTAVNSELIHEPGLVKEDPYGNGWVAEIELFDFDSDMDCLMNAEEYSRFAKARAEMGPQGGCPCSRFGRRK